MIAGYLADRGFGATVHPIPAGRAQVVDHLANGTSTSRQRRGGDRTQTVKALRESVPPGRPGLPVREPPWLLTPDDAPWRRVAA